MSLKTIGIILALATVMTIIGLPFGVLREAFGAPETVGIDFHIWITFMYQKFIDLGHYGHPTSVYIGYFNAFILNFTVVAIILMLLKRDEK